MWQLRPNGWRYELKSLHRPPTSWQDVNPEECNPLRKFAGKLPLTLLSKSSASRCLFNEISRMPLVYIAKKYFSFPWNTCWAVLTFGINRNYFVSNTVTLLSCRTGNEVTQQEGRACFRTIRSFVISQTWFIKLFVSISSRWSIWNVFFLWSFSFLCYYFVW